MRRRLLLLLLLLLAASYAAGHGSANTNTVYVFRHCVRSIEMTSLAPYSTRTFPSWGVPKDTCLPRGLDIMQGVGRHLLAEGLVAPTVVADDVPRNIASATALAKGLGLAPSSAVSVNGSAFVRCAAPSDKEKQKLISKRLSDAPPPANTSGLVGSIDRVLGGKKHIAGEKDKVSDGKLKGCIALASMAAETFLMQYGAGMPIGWGEVTPAEIFAMEQMHVYEWAIDRHSKKIEQAKSSRMLATIVQLLGGEANHTSIFLGHDTDINGLGRLLDIGWHAPPFAPNTTAPNVALKFEARGGAVTVTFVYTDFATSEGVLLSTPVLSESASGFCQRTAAALDPACAPMPSGGLCGNVKLKVQQIARNYALKSDDHVPAVSDTPCAIDDYQWICEIERGSEHQTYALDAKLYHIDKQYQLPTGTQLRGQGPGRTLIHAVGTPKNYSNVGNRKGFIMSNDTSIGGFSFRGVEVQRTTGMLGGGVIETPGCLNDVQTQGGCGNSTGRRGNGAAVSNVLVENIEVLATNDGLPSVNVNFWMPETRFGVCNNVTVRNLSSHGSWADGLNVHGAHTNLLIEDCTIRNSGDDAFAMWSNKDGMKNVTFMNNFAYNPTYPWNGTHRDGSIPPWGSNHVNCFAAYGGGGQLKWINNSCTPAPRGMMGKAVPHQWNDTAVIVFHTDFNGVFSPDSVATIRGNSFSGRTADGRPTRKNFPVCNWATPLSQRATPRLAQPHDQPCTNGTSVKSDDEDGAPTERHTAAGSPQCVFSLSQLCGYTIRDGDEILATGAPIAVFVAGR
eukprot:SAG31_NODE_402_length_16197_cov_5.262425_9_plen_790_part_00